MLPFKQVATVLVAAVIVPCNRSPEVKLDGGVPMDVTFAHGAFFSYALDRLSVPAHPFDFALDLDGDGHPDNQLGALFESLSAENNFLLASDLQLSADLAVQTGEVVQLLRFQTAAPIATTDTGAQKDDENDDSAGAAWIPGVPFAVGEPNFDGTGAFTATQEQAQFFGKLKLGTFASNNPAATNNPVSCTLTFAFGTVAPQIVTLPLQGCALRASVAFGPGPRRLRDGQLNGSLTQKTLSDVIVPAITANLNAILVTQPGSTLAQKTRTNFDNGGCPACMGGTADDGLIDDCEVQCSSLLTNALQLDIRIRDDQGNYAPNAIPGKKKDAYSVGVGFTAVQATF